MWFAEFPCHLSPTLSYALPLSCPSVHPQTTESQLASAEGDGVYFGLEYFE